MPAVLPQLCLLPLLLLSGCGADLDSAATPASQEATVDTAAVSAVDALETVKQRGTPVVRTVLERPTIQPLPIVWNDERLELTAEHLEHHLGFVIGDDLDVSTRMDPKVIVLHWTAGPSAMSAFWTFYSPRRVRRDPHHQLNLSVHFIVDRDGTIYQLMPTDRVGAHVVGLNHVAIGIENVGDRERWPLTYAQVDANIELVRYLAGRHDISHLIGHYEFKKFHGHPMWRGPDGRNIGRGDPGETFMAEVRRGVADLDLLGAPEAPDPTHAQIRRRVRTQELVSVGSERRH